MRIESSELFMKSEHTYEEANFGDRAVALTAEKYAFDIDSDGNSWIDENDAIYNKLRIWMKDENGADQLVALGQQGVGAIYLGHTDTVFDLKNSSTALQGRVRSSGIYLRENGTVGTIQQIDLAI